MQAVIITIGDELIQGFTVNSNGSWLSNYLTSRGIEVIKRICVPDNKHIIIKSLDYINENYDPDYIIITGGLGPTHDDITKKVLSDYFMQPLVLDLKYLSYLKLKFDKNNLSIPINLESQALILKNSIPIVNESGTALGMIINENNNQFIVLPGVPSEMKQMIKDCNIFKDVSYLKYITLSTMGAYESTLYNVLKDIIDNSKTKYKLAFLPKYSGVNIRISKKDLSLPDSDLLRFKFDIYDAIGEYIYSDKNELLEEVVINMLIQNNVSISVAESCTGGLISKKITDVSGSSKVYKGGVVAYSNFLKVKLLNINEHIIKKYGAVSKEVAKLMAEGIKNKTRSQISIATTGISGPTGETKEKSIGLIYIAVSYNDQTIVKKFNLLPKRDIHREIGSSIALNMIRKILNKKNLH